MCIGHNFDKCWKLNGKIVEKPLIKESTRYTSKKFKHAILVNDSVDDIENDKFVNIIANEILNGDSKDLNKVGNHTLENEIEKDDSVVAIQ